MYIPYVHTVCTFNGWYVHVVGGVVFQLAGQCDLCKYLRYLTCTFICQHIGKLIMSTSTSNLREEVSTSGTYIGNGPFRNNKYLRGSIHNTLNLHKRL